MNDGQLEAQPAANAQEPASKPKFQKTVTLLWTDVIRYLDEIEATSPITKVDVPLEIISLAITSIYKKGPVVGKVLRIDTQLEDLTPYAESKIRLVEKICNVLAALLRQTQESIDPRVYDVAVSNLCDLYHTELPTITAMRAFFCIDVQPAIKFLVDEISGVNPHTRLLACKLIEEIEELETATQSNLHALTEPVKTILEEATSNTQEKLQLCMKLFLLSQMNTNLISMIPNLASQIGELPVVLFHHLLDFLLICEVKSATASFIENTITHIVRTCSNWQEAARVNILCKLLEFAKVSVHDGRSDTIPKILSEVVTGLLSELVSKATVEKEPAGWLSSCACKVVELLTICIERNSDIQMVVDSMPIILNVIEPLAGDPVPVDSVLRRTLDFAAYSLATAHGKELIIHGLPAILYFIENGLDKAFLNDGDVLAKCLDLGILFVRQKADAKSFCSFFKEHMVQSFQIPLSWECDVETKKGLVLDILIFGYLSIQNKNMNRYKFFCWFMPPTYELIDHLDLSGASVSKATILKNIAEVCLHVTTKGDDMDLLLRDGVPMIVKLYGPRDPTQLAAMVKHAATKFEIRGSYQLLLELNYRLNLAYTSFTFVTHSQIENLFCFLIEKGKRDWVNIFLKICSPELCHERYSTVRTALFTWMDRISPKEFVDFCAVVNSFMELFRTEQENNETVLKITQYILSKLDGYINENKLNKQCIADIREKLSHIILYRSLFASELEQNKDKSPQELMEVLQSKFPEDVAQSAEMMNLLTLIAQRIQHTDTNRPKYKHVTAMTRKCLETFFSYKVPNAATLPPTKQLAARQRMLEEYILNLPKNVELRERLMQVGYHKDLFIHDIAVRIEVDDTQNIDENFKLSLSNLYGEYIDILKQLYPNIQSVKVGNADIKLQELFQEDHQSSLSVEDLRSRRNIVIKLIEKKRKDHERSSYFQNRKLALLAREDQLEQEMEQQKMKQKLEPLQKRTYWIRFNSTFFNVVATCGANIVGCYAPNGDHAEKPLENGLKVNAKFISVYEDDPDNPGTPGIEIENVEVLMTDQGLYVYKIYSNGHPYDTSVVWVQFFKILVESNYVPCIIIPHQFPNIRTYRLLESFIPPQIAGSILTLKDDFFEESGVDSYYDFKADKIKSGDIIIDEKTVTQIELLEVNVKTGLRTSTGRTRLRSSTGVQQVEKTDKQRGQYLAARRRAELDLGGVLLSSTLAKLKTIFNEDESLKSSFVVESFAKFISQYISHYVDTGCRDPNILAVGLDLAQWNRRKRGKKNANQLTQEDKVKIIRILHDTIHSEIEQLCSDTKLLELFKSHRRNFFDLQRHCEKLACGKDQKDTRKTADSSNIAPAPENQEDQNKANEMEHIKSVFDQKALAEVDLARAKLTLQRIKSILLTCQRTFVLGDLPRKFQEQIIKWIFGNEDRVWRDRGGRPGEESLQTFLSFVRPALESSHTTTSELPPANTESQDSQNIDDSVENEEDKTEFRPDHYGKTPFGGLVTIAAASDNENVEVVEHAGQSGMIISQFGEGLQSSGDDVVAYSIGDWVSEDNFEIVTAWVHPRYRGLRVALNHYIQIAKLVEFYKGRYLTFDILQNTLERIYSQSIVLRILMRLGFYSRLVKKRKKSYTSETVTGEEEQFEKITVDISWGMWGFRVYERVMWLWNLLFGKRGRRINMLTGK